MGVTLVVTCHQVWVRIAGIPLEEGEEVMQQRKGLSGDDLSSTSPGEMLCDPAALDVARCPPPQVVIPKLPRTKAAAPPRRLLLLP